MRRSFRTSSEDGSDVELARLGVHPDDLVHVDHGLVETLDLEIGITEFESGEDFREFLRGAIQHLGRASAIDPGSQMEGGGRRSSSESPWRRAMSVVS